MAKNKTLGVARRRRFSSREQQPPLVLIHSATATFDAPSSNSNERYDGIVAPGDTPGTSFFGS